VLRAELWSYFWPNCDCMEFGVLEGVLTELLRKLESTPQFDIAERMVMLG
jgi:hypothetical protein